jgi:cbb3-type cytochrome oxidase maturation protein
MDVLIFLIPVSLGLGALGLGAFLWTLRHGQYEDPDGNGARILRKDYDDAPPEDPT